MTNTNPNPLPPGGGPNRRPRNLRGHERLDLLYDVAVGDIPLRALGKKYGRAASTISEYCKRPENAAAIQRIRDAGMDKLAGLWIADKAARVAQYQHDAEDFGDSSDATERRVAQAALRAVAEETGQLILKTEITTVAYQFGDGTDPLTEEKP